MKDMKVHEEELLPLLSSEARTWQPPKAAGEARAERRSNEAEERIEGLVRSSFRFRLASPADARLTPGYQVLAFMAPHVLHGEILWPSVHPCLASNARMKSTRSRTPCSGNAL